MVKLKNGSDQFGRGACYVPDTADNRRIAFMPHLCCLLDPPTTLNQLQTEPRPAKTG